MARVFKDGAGASYDVSTNKFNTVPFGQVLVNPADPKQGTAANAGFFEFYNFGATAAGGGIATSFPWLTGVTGPEAFKAMADNSVAGIMRDCAECHVGGGMHEYAYNNMPTAAYDPSQRTPLRSFDFTGLTTAYNYFIDIFNPDPARRGDAVEQKYSETGVLEMDCLMCHLKDYDWEGRKHAVRQGEFDASRAVGAKLVNGVKNGTTVFYNYTAVKTNAAGELVVDLSANLNSKPESGNCASCHLSQYNVDWKKRGEQWLPGSDVHESLGCMACHERSDKAAPTVGTEGTINNKLGLCDPAKGGSSAFDAMWNKLDTVNFKQCSSCHEPSATPTYATYGAPNSVLAHANAGLTAKIAFNKAGAPASHMEIIDCTACHIKKTFDGGAFVDGTGADEEGRVALHDEPQVARDMTNGNALYWDNGKLYAANLLTSFFVRDMNGMDPANNGLDANNDGRTAGMDALLQTHVNDLNNANGRHAVTHAQNGDGSWVNESEVGAMMNMLKGDGTGANGIKKLLGITDPNNDKKLLPKISFLMVPFKASHNIAPAETFAWGKGGCVDCHGTDKGFYNGAYPIRGNMDGQDANGNFLLRWKSNQVSTFTKVNGLNDVTDSHPNVVTKKGDRTVPVPMLTKFDNPYTADASAVANQTLRNIDRSEVIYEQTFQTRDTTWHSTITGAAPLAACSSPKSPFYCATPVSSLNPGVTGEDFKAAATSTKGWLLKIEVRPLNDADPSKITFRTAQLGNDKAGSMADVFAALPASFKANGDFTITQAGGALTITADATKQIRISPQSDSAPYGLLGKVYVADPIKRAGVADMKTRSEYVAYLDGVSTSMADYGIGIDPKAAINAIVDDNATQLGTQWSKGIAHAVTAPLAQPNAGQTADIGSVAYLWSTSDETAVISDATSRTAATVTFGSTGSKSVTLRVTDEEGKVKTASVAVTVIEPPVAIEWNQATDVATFSNLPVGTTAVRVYWGDGQVLTKTSGVTDPLSLAHSYSTATGKIIQIYCYNASGKQLGYMQKTILP